MEKICKFETNGENVNFPTKFCLGLIGRNII